MTRKLITVGVVVIVLGVVFVMLGPLYILDEGEQAVVTRFGEIVQVETDAGLKFRLPLVDQVVRYPKRIQSWDGDPNRMPTEEQQFIWVDTTARWRITDPALFYASLYSVEAAYARLDEVIESSVRNTIAAYELAEAVRDSNHILETEPELAPVSDADADELEELEEAEELEDLLDVQDEQPSISRGRRALSDEMLRTASEVAPDFGVELIDVVIRQIRYADDLTESVYDRMVSERARFAEFYRSFGEGRKREILGQLESEKARILSRAYRDSEEILAAAEGEAGEIYSASYSQSPEFFDFYRGVQSYEEIVPRFRKTLTTDMDYFRFLHNEMGE